MLLSGRGRAIVWVAFAVYAVALAYVLLGPSTRPGDGGIDLGTRILLRAGTPDHLVTQERVEALLNVALLTPLSALGSLLWPRLGWRDWTAYGFVLAVGAEAWQGLAYAARTAAFSDVVANTGGALVGALAVSVVRELVGRSSPEGRQGRN